MSDDYFNSTEYIRHTFCSDDGMYYPEEEETFDRWLAEMKAQAWADGYTAGTHDWRIESLTTPNPYRGENK